MKISNLKKQLSAAIFSAIMLLTISLLITPITYGQQLVANETATGIAWPNPVGVGQTVLLSGFIYPNIGGSALNVSFTITGPNSTTQTLSRLTDYIGEASLTYVCQIAGSWSCKISFAGDATHSAASITINWVVQQNPVTTQLIETHSSVATIASVIQKMQTMYIVGWVNPAREYNGPSYYGLVFTITKPDGTTATVTKNTDSPATASFGYLCDQVGIYKVVLRFPGDAIHGASTSPPATWEVRENYIAPVTPNVPLPNYPWTYPVSTEFTDWWQITGPWTVSQRGDMGRTNSNPYTKGPNSPHVLWSKPLDVLASYSPAYPAGLLGGDQGGVGFAKPVPVEMVSAQGRCWYTTAEGNSSSTVKHPVVHCIDQATGEEIYKRDLPGSGTGAQTYLEITGWGKISPTAGVDIAAFNLWVIGGGVWQVEPWSGNCLYYLAGASGNYYDGALYLTNYPVSGNMTKMSTLNKAILWNQKGVSFSFIDGDLLSGYSQFYTNGVQGIKITTYNATTGELIVDGPVIQPFFSSEGFYKVGYHGKFYSHCSLDNKLYAFDLKTGNVAWTSEPWDYPWGSYSTYDNSAGYGNVYMKSYDGYIRCYNADTGALKWKFFFGNTTETAMGHYVPWADAIIADGKVYVATGEHTPQSPPAKGNSLFCIDAFSGDLIWKLDNFAGRYQNTGIASGMLWYFNDYDSKCYMFGLGTTETTVSVQQNVIAKGATVLITGKVTDQSPGAKGTPCVSEDSMSAQMQYLYYNKPEPTNITGVLVHLVAINSNGTTMDITHVTTDASGLYAYMWTPPTQDIYRIVANFEGSNSYYSSHGETALGVIPATVSPIVTPTLTPTVTASPIVTPAVAPTPTPTTPQGPSGLPASTMYAIAAAVVIIIIVAVAALVLRRRK